MRTEMVIRIDGGGSSEKGQQQQGAKAMKVAAAMQGVESVTLSGKDKSLLRVLGDGVDCNHLTTRLRRKLGHADVVELRTLHAAAGSYYGYGSGSGSRTGSFSRSNDAAGYGNGNGGGSYYGHGDTYPTAAAAAANDYYYYGQQQQRSFQYDSYQPPPPPYAAVRYEYDYPAANDPNGCSIM